MSTEALARLSPEMRVVAQQAQPPEWIGIPEEDWGAMPVEERCTALQIYGDEIGRSMRDLTPEFPKIKTPSQGSLHWTMPDGDPVKTFDAVIVAHFKARGYWPLDQPVSNNPPMCSSVDGKVPVSGEGPTGAATCGTCPLSEFGTGRDGEGQACKQRMNVFLAFPGAKLPTLLSLPPTGIRPYSRYVVGLLNQRPPRPVTGLVTTFALEQRTSKRGVPYSVAAPKPGNALPFAEMRAAIAMRNKFEEMMSRRGVTPADVAAEAEAPTDEPPPHGDDDVPF